MTHAALRIALAVLAASPSLAHSGGKRHPHHHFQHALPSLLASPLTMDVVTLTPGSRFDVQRARNMDYLLSMNATDLLCEYTSAANLTGTFDNPTCVKKDDNGYFGHYLGHWVSATAMLCNATSNASVCAAGAAVVARLAQAQAAWVAAAPEYAGGYLFPYSIVSWSNLFGPPSRNCAPVCVPFYIFHKMLAGMLDQHLLTGNAQALQVAVGMATWATAAIEGVLATGGQGLWQSVLATEWGGMNDALYNLYAVTGDARWQTAAAYFNHWDWTAPLAIGEDDLPGNHANTHIPEVVGDARGYELTGNATKHAIVANFFDILTSAHSFSTGGSNDGEHWGAPHQLGDEMNADTEESCTTYNVLKVARHEFAWTLNASFFDFYERALLNGLIGNQARTGPFAPETHTTGYIYMLPLGGGGLSKPWGASDEGLPCCWGTLSETFAKLTDSIYWAAADGATLYVNLFVASTAAWRGFAVTQATSYPYAAKSTTRITLAGGPGLGPGLGASTFTLAVRVPGWATSGANAVAVNGVPFAGPAVPGSYLAITRAWAAGDAVDVLFPSALRFEPLDDFRPAWAGVGAIMFGGVLLAAVNGSSDRLPLDTARLAAAVTRSPPPADGADYTDMVFTANSSGCGAAPLIPLMDVTFERYAAYLHTGNGSAGGAIGYNASGYSVVPGGADGFATSGGAAVVPNGGGYNIRSGDPGEVNTVVYAAPLQDAVHPVTGLRLSYQYVAGYGGDGAPGGATFALVAVAASACSSGGGDGPVLATLYTSPVLSHFPFDVCNTCYSPPVDVVLPRGTLALNVSGDGVQLAFVFTNNERNVQLNLPIDATVYWG